MTQQQAPAMTEERDIETQRLVELGRMALEYINARGAIEGAPISAPQSELSRLYRRADALHTRLVNAGAALAFDLAEGRR